MESHLFTHFKTQKHQNETTFQKLLTSNIGWAYVRNLDYYMLIRTHQIALFVKGNNGSSSYDVTCFDSFGFNSKEIKNIRGNKNIITKIYRIQAYDSVMRG